MTFSELVVAVAKWTDLPKTVVSKVLRGMIVLTKAEMRSEGTVKLHGFGTFYTKPWKRETLFGGRLKGRTDRPVVRFKESRHGKAGRSHRTREDEDS